MRLLLLCLLSLIGTSSLAAEKAAVVSSGDDAPSLLVRANADQPWKVARSLETLTAGSQVIGGLGATVDSANGAVRIKLMGDVGGHSPFPILETSFIVREVKGFDFALDMDRGRVDLINLKKAGAAKIQLTIRGKIGEITLKEPGARLVVEMYSRWPKGVRFTQKPTDQDVPSLALLFIAANGEVHLKGEKQAFDLKAPSMILVDGLHDEMPQVQHLDKLPHWVDAKEHERHKHIKDSLKKFHAAVDKAGVGPTLLLLTKSDDEHVRHSAVILLGAIDDLALLASAIATANHDDVSDVGILVLRHWIGREPGQDLKLYNTLVDKAMYKPAEAAFTLQLLHSFSDADLRKPETYQALIHFMDSERMAIRGLAHWHLIRLVPEGKKIEFKLTGSEPERAKAIKAWQALVPEGTVPGHKKK